ncbi:hypothetical protein C7A07_20705 [Pseudomonas fragi]|nr:hypothetical protein [Pseudomonas fragi]PRW96641.1 hypothetical protein C7A07_20705 [Pseudomonas fragi]
MCRVRLNARGFECGSGLARDTGSAVCQSWRSDAIASKPAPTVEVPGVFDCSACSPSMWFKD